MNNMNRWRLDIDQRRFTGRLERAYEGGSIDGNPPLDGLLAWEYVYAEGVA